MLLQAILEVEKRQILRQIWKSWCFGSTGDYRFGGSGQGWSTWVAGKGFRGFFEEKNISGDSEVAVGNFHEIRLPHMIRGSGLLTAPGSHISHAQVMYTMQL